MVKHAFLKLAAAVVVSSVAMNAYAVVTVIEGFENNADPGGWQQVSSSPQTHNSTNVTTPVYVTTNVTEGLNAGQFPVNWVTPGSAAATNYYVPADGLTFWSNRQNISVPAAFNTVPNSNALFQADIFNPTTDPIQVAFYVQDNGGSGGLERGPFVTLAPNASTTYSWNMGVDPVVSYITGNGTLDGTTSRLRGFFVYTPIAPTVTPLLLDVDNIRIDAQSDLTAPATPVIVSAKQETAVPGELTVRWIAGSDPDLAGYKIYTATDAEFGVPIANRFGFSATPAATVMTPSATSTVLTGIPTGVNVYVRVTAIDTATPVTNESLSDIVLAVNLKADGSAPADLLVLDYDRYNNTESNFVQNGYFHGSAYWAQALSASTRNFESVKAAGIDAGTTLLSSYSGIVFWSTARDGELVADQTLTTLSETAISGYLGSGGDLLISGTSLGEDLATNGDAGDQTFYANTLKASLLNENTASGDLNADANFPTAAAFATQPDVFNVGAGSNTDNELVTPLSTGVGALTYGAITPGNAAVLDSNALVYFAFAFETVRDPASPTGVAAAATKRAAVLADAITYLEAAAPSDASSWSMYQ